MNMFLHELRANRKSTITWTISLCAVAILFMSLYPAFSADVVDARKLLEGLPEGVRKALGLSLDSFFTIMGFYSYIFLYIVLCGAIQAMNLGTSIISKEVREKTADFLLTKPVSRQRIMASKLFAAFTSLIITNVIFFIVSFIMTSIVNTEAYNIKIFILISLTLFFIQLIFMSLGVIISVLVPKIRSVLPITLGTVFGFFILNMFDSVIGAKAARYIIPFLYFDNNFIIKNVTYEFSYLIVALLFIIASISASFWVYSKKDIHAV